MNWLTSNSAKIIASYLNNYSYMTANQISAFLYLYYMPLIVYS